MQNHQENPETLEEIVFQHRNKSYGAYLLRTDYQNVIKKSLLIGISIFGLAVLTPTFFVLLLRIMSIMPNQFLPPQNPVIRVLPFPKLQKPLSPHRKIICLEQ